MTRKNSVLKGVPWARQELATWPKVEANALPEAERFDFLNKRKAIVGLFSGATYKEIEKETGLTAPTVRYLLKRCVRQDGEGDICGERALVAYVRTTCYRRRSTIERTCRSGRGYCAGALQQLFDELPEIELRLRQEILKQLPKKEKLPEARISVKALHSIFLTLCRSAGKEERNEWPFNTKTVGLSAIRRFRRQVAHEQPSAFIRAHVGKDAATRLATGTGYDAIFLPQQPFDVVGIDELTFDAIGTVLVSVPGGGLQDVAIDRLHLVIVVEKISKAILSWHAFFTQSVAASDIRKAIQKASSPWQPMTFSIPGLSYGNDQAGYPSGRIEGLAYQPWVALFLDNALGHQDVKLLDDIGQVTGQIVNFGPVGAWYRRADVERAIGQILRDSAQRLPSTTGNSPIDPRRKNPVQTAVAKKIRWDEILQLIEVTLAQYNAKPSEGTGFLSPMDTLQQASSDPLKLLKRPLPKEMQTANCISGEAEIVPVKGAMAKGRRPHILLDRCVYTNPALANRWDLIGQAVRVVIGDDFRHLEASVIGTGQPLGVLSVRGAWARTKHTREIRKAINQLKHRRILAIPSDADPVQIYGEYLAQRAQVEGTKRQGTGISSSAKKLYALEQSAGRLDRTVRKRRAAEGGASPPAGQRNPGPHCATGTGRPAEEGAGNDRPPRTRLDLATASGPFA